MSIGRPTTGTRIEANLPAETLDPLDDIAAALDMDRAALIRRALREWVDANGVSAIQIRDTHGEWQTTRHEPITREQVEGADPGRLAARLGAFDDKEVRSLMAVDPGEWRLDVTWFGAWTGAELEEGGRKSRGRSRRSPGSGPGVVLAAQPEVAEESLADWERELLQPDTDA